MHRESDMEDNYIYAPEVRMRDSAEFRCRVPMQDTEQQFLVDGRLESDAPLSSGYVSSDNGVCFSLGRNEKSGKVLQMISVRHDSALERLSFRNEIRLAENSSAKLLLCSHTMTLDRYITEETVDMTLDEDASLDLVIMQNEHNDAVRRTVFNISMKRGARLNMCLVSLHGGEIDNKVKVNLDGEHCECRIGGLYLVDGSQRYSTDVRMNHNVPYCTSNQLFKGILDDNSSAEFSGIVYVAPDAQKTEAMQSNHNLLASDDARIDTRPQLEIYADDVKCSHGATVGRLDEEAAFYMRSRGIASREARILQQLAFVHEVLERVGNVELRERLSSLVEKRLRGEFSRCSNCSRNCC